MSITPEAVKDFVNDAKKARESWLVQADRSWNEIKRTQKNKKLWATIPNAVRRRTKYPAWYSIMRIRQPLWLSRVGIPIARDTTQDGNDNLGATAAMLKERLAVNLAKNTDFFETMCCVRDDCLATNFGMARAYYEAKDVKEEVKIRLTAQPDELGNIVFFDEQGEQVLNDNIEQDDEGYFLDTEQVVDVTDEVICLEPVLYKNVYIDPSIKRWAKCKQLAFEENYTEAEFKEIFGAKAFAQLPRDGKDGDNNAGKKTLYKVYEYWDLYSKEVVWLPELGDEFVTPKNYNSEDEEAEKVNGLYNLEKFFPCPKPLTINQPTDSFWPVPEYFQLADIIEDIHTVFSRMMLLTGAIRPRLLFDANVEGLAPALNELSTADAIGITNLTQSLMNSGGSLEGVVQYVPVEKMIQALEQMYEALEQRLNTLYKLTGTSDLLQGLITDPTQRTFGERQMTEKYALNQSAEGQRKMAEYVRDSYELLCEMALKNFKDESLAKYIIPETLQDDMKGQYKSALELLKDNNKRFRIELETDSTIALNEEFDKQMRMEFVNTLTTALEKTANIAETAPNLIVPELHCLKFLIQGFRQGKMFQEEVTQAIDLVIEQAQQPKPPEFNPEQANAEIQQQTLQLKAQELQLKGQEVQSNSQLKQYELLSNERYNNTKLQAEMQIAQLSSQVEQLKAQTSMQEAAAKSQADIYKIEAQKESDNTDAQISYAKLQSDIALAQQNLILAQEELRIKQEELAFQMQQAMGEHEIEQIRTGVDARSSEQSHALDIVREQREAQKMVLDEREKYATEERLQAEEARQSEEHELNKVLIAKEITSTNDKA